MTLKIVLPAIRYNDIPTGSLFCNSTANKLFVMTGELDETFSKSSFTIGIKKAIQINKWHNEKENAFERFDAVSLKQILDDNYYLVATDGVLSEIKQ